MTSRVCQNITSWAVQGLKKTSSHGKHCLPASQYCFSTGQSSTQQSLEEWKKNLGKSRVVSSYMPPVEIPKISYPQYGLRQMEKHGNRIFLVNGETGAEYTYHDSLREVTRVASALIRRGVRPGDRVAFFCQNRPEYILAWFAATSIGAIATDANPSFTAGELRGQLENTNATYLFTNQSNAATAREAVSTLPAIKEIYVFGTAEKCVPYSELTKDSGDLFKGPADVDLSSTIHLPCSSGTTGLPKGVMRSHTNLVATVYVTNNDDVLLFEPDDTGLIMLPHFHMYGNFMIGTILLTGAKAVLQEKFVPEQTLGLIQKHRVTNFPVVPPLVLFLNQHPLVNKYDLSSLQKVMSGAAPCSLQQFQTMKDRFNLKVVAQGYGMTEMCPVSMNTVKAKNLSSCGMLVPNTEIKVVSLETGEDLGLECTGEIYARGPQIMSGYERNPDATNSTLVEGWLRTGDIGYVGRDGHLFIVDRLKDFIKVKGSQVAPAELEALLLTHPSVQDAAVIGVKDEKCGEVPRAFVVLKDGKTKPEEIKQFVAERTNSEKHLMGGVVIMDAIPKTASGKILKKNLRVIDS